MRLLFVKESLAWPRLSGHDVHCYEMMRALSGLGHAVGLLTAKEPAAEAVHGLDLDWRRTLDALPADAAGPRLSRLQEQYRSYWGIEEKRIVAVGEASREFRADAVVVVGLAVLPYLGAVEGAVRVWYAADEWAWHHLSQMRLTQPGTWHHLKEAIIKGLYERAYRRVVERVWVVSDADRRAMRWLGGVANVDVIANGVDADYYRPGPEPTLERSCVFWGRLDFGPNVQALDWFCRRVWPWLQRQEPAARFTIYGFQPTAAVHALAGDGVEVVADLPDLRAEIAQHQVVVFPFQSGGGIKNKLLEAASMGKAIVCTPRTTSGLRAAGEAPLVSVRRPGQWVREVRDLWHNPQRRQRLGQAARQWVIEHHSWKTAAELAATSLTGPVRDDRGGQA